MMNHRDLMQFLLFILVNKNHVLLLKIIIVLEQHRHDKELNGNLVQASFDGIHRPVQSTFDGL